MFHIREAGEYRISLPESMSKTKELYTGLEFNSSEIILKTEGPDTFLFKARN